MFFSKCKKSLPDIADFDSILAWWKSVRNYFSRTAFFPSTSTKNLDFALSHFDIWIDEQHTLLSQRYIEHLVTLSHAVTSWLADHQHNAKSSSRLAQVNMLGSWIDSHLQTETKLNFRKSPTPPNSPVSMKKDLLTPLLQRQYTKAFDAKLKKVGEGPDNYTSLESWWKQISKLSFFKRRSASTRLIDQAVHNFSNDVIFDRTEACHHLLAEIHIWKMRRENTSERLEAIQHLENYLDDQIEQLKKCDTFSSIIRNGCYAFISWPLCDLDLTGLFDCLTLFRGVNI